MPSLQKRVQKEQDLGVYPAEADSTKHYAMEVINIQQMTVSTILQTSLIFPENHQALQKRCFPTFD